MKKYTILILSLTLLWLAILAYFSFFTEASSTTTMMIYITGQGFLTALIISKWGKYRSCKSQELD